MGTASTLYDQMVFTPFPCTALARVLLITVLAVLPSCRAHPTPLPEDALQEPALGEIHRAMRLAVERARADPHVTWHAGWSGNMVVNALGGTHKGLCYDWQQLVYTAVTPAARRVGWKAVGLAAGEGLSWEHHAVIVYDPARCEPARLLEGPPHAYVLDAWRRGRADVFILSQWLECEQSPRVSPRIEDLDASAVP